MTRHLGLYRNLFMAMMWAPAFAQAPAQPDHDHATPAPQGNTGRGGMMPIDHQKMMADIVAEDTRLQELVAG